MSVSSPPVEQRVVGRLGRHKARRRFSPWLLLPLVLLLGAGFWLWRSMSTPATPAVTITTATATTGTLSLSVSGSGTVQPIQTRNLTFAVAGTVSEVLVQVGDTVVQGQPLARLDTQDLQMALLQAEANLKSAQANVAAAQGEGATANEVALAQVQLTSAQASYEKTRTGDVTAAEVAAAQAQVASAQAQLDDLLDGPSSTDLANAQSSVEQARLSLESQRISLSAAKTKAESGLTTAANTLRDAQESYSTIYWNNREQERARGELTQSAKDDEAAALRAVENAQENLRQAELAYEQAQQAETIGIQQAEANLSDAEQQLAEVQNGVTASEIASARASLASAKSNLANLQHPASAQDLAMARASLEQARLNLENLSSPGSASTLASAEANLAQAQVAYAQAKLDLANASLTAPFAGVVAEVAADPGDAASAATITLIDASAFVIDLSLSESDIGTVAVGQPVTLSFDALSDLSLTGEVQSVAPVATVTSNVATYTVRVSFRAADAPIKAGMSATGDIQTVEHRDVLLVPTRAIQTVNDTKVVRVQQSGQPPRVVQVQTGLSSDGMTEIVGCAEGEATCLQAGDTVLIVSSSSSSSSTTRQSSLFSGGMGGPPPDGGGRP
ncbi:HlyD family efflux transporter periplasmic adaptor subunit [Candidatus Oscillochloris fontis]|uniref:HlyD family efflux transporter periplasmic adaptor subunit n=1 Tax=Candidatus Oscillochloris fontis TaxID=2496868 RepID=UPI00101DD50A|nr:HlyD family efflux transporter periplasmic adaptor subunit [Candidatus Oscillochloris fontis]